MLDSFVFAPFDVLEKVRDRLAGKQGSDIR
jgi:hypothetical protein